MKYQYGFYPAIRMGKFNISVEILIINIVDYVINAPYYAANKTACAQFLCFLVVLCSTNENKQDLQNRYLTVQKYTFNLYEILVCTINAAKAPHWQKPHFYKGVLSDMNCKQ